MDIDALFTEERTLDLYVLARFMYRIGEPIFKDADYEELQDYLDSINQSHKYLEYRSRSYDDDDVPMKLLKEFNLLNKIPKTGSDNPYAKALDEDKSLSIRAVDKAIDVYNYILSHPNTDIIISLKVNGVNNKSIYDNGTYKITLSRGRKGNSFDLTQNMAKVIPMSITDSHAIKVYSESYVVNEYLSYASQKYGQAYKTERMTAMSMLRVNRDDEDYKYLRTLVFGSEGLPFKLKSECLEYLEQQGLTTVPHTVINTRDIPTETLEAFKPWLDVLCDSFWEGCKNIPSDGLVMDINDSEFIDNVNGMYSDRNIAVKLNQWQCKAYKGIISDILIVQNRVYASVRVSIVPMVTDDNCDARVINIYNPSILFEEGLSIGSEVNFYRDSGAINKLVRSSNNKMEIF